MIRLAKTLSCTETESAALALLAAAFGNTESHVLSPETVDWYAVFEELKSQTMAGVASDVLSAYRDFIPQELYQSWVLYTALVAKGSCRILSAQESLFSHFTKAHLPAVIMKGSAAARYYPNPLLRNCGDIDFLVCQKDFDRAHSLLKESGYTLAFPEDHTDYHLTFVKDRIFYELHREPAGIAQNPYGDILRHRFRDAAAKAESAAIDRYTFLQLPQLENGLVLLLHIAKHLDGGLGLRQLCDWMAFVKAELTDEIYKTEFLPILRETGLETLACTAAKACCLYLGLTGITWCLDADDETCAALMRFILNNGNFGKKDASSNRAGAVLGKTQDAHRPFLIRAFSHLQELGMTYWEPAKKYPPLRCVAWGYVPVRYLGRMLTGKRNFKDTRRLIFAIANDKSLKEKLAVFTLPKKEIKR